MPTADLRFAATGEVIHGTLESIAWAMDLSAFTVKPSSIVSVAIYDVTDLDTPLSDLLDGEASIDDDGNIVLPVISGLTAGHRYRVDVVAVFGDSELNLALLIECKR
jgi:hypothetical protein